MFQQTADIEKRHVAQAGIAISGEQRLAILPQRLVRVHAGSVVTEEGLRHERDRLAVLVCHILGHVLVDAHFVRRPQEGIKHDVDLGLARGGDLMVLALDRHAESLHRQDHFVANVDQLVGRGHREVTFLVPNLVAEIGGAVLFLLFPAIPDTFDGIEVIIRAVGRRVVADAVEDEELRFGSKESGVGEARALEISLRFLGDAAGIAIVDFARDRVDHVAREAKRRILRKGIDECRGAVRNHQHVRCVDDSPAPDRGAVKAEAFLEYFFGQLIHGNRKVLPGAVNVAELEVDNFDFFVLGEFDCFLRCHVDASFFCWLGEQI